MTRIDIASTRLSGKEEGKRTYPYNDSTGKRVTCKPNGNITIGVGINLEVGLDEEEIAWTLNHRLTKADTSLRAYPWYSPLDEIRGSVFLDVAFNSGVDGLLHFVHTIHFASVGAWPQCAAALMDSAAARSDPRRYEILKNILITGLAA
jgi:lysozyme